MGTLSGGNNAMISIGENCLLGANSGIGISLGDNCIVEAGLYITAGTKIHFFDKDKGAPKILKAFEISGTSNLLFIRDSYLVELLQSKILNYQPLIKELHKND